MASIKYLGIIPARYNSSRLPGKPLVDLGGKTMIERIYTSVSQSIDTVLVATDDERIYQHVRSFNGNAIMTRKDHVCGTDRCLEAYLHYKMQLPPDTPLSHYPNNWQTYCDTEDIIINIQGDEPFVTPQQINAILSCFQSDITPSPQIATLICPFAKKDSWETLSDPNTPKVVIKNFTNTEIVQILMFSRSVIPFLRDISKEKWIQQGIYFKHIGMYAYRANVLAAITQLPPSPLEKAEKLEQLRWIENGYTIYAAIINHHERGIDTEDDLQRAKNLLKQNNLN